MGQFGSMAEIGVMAVVPSAPIAGYVTGCQVVVDGGFGLPGTGMTSRVLEDAAATQDGRRK